MSTKQNYLLLVDQDEDILELQEAALKYFYGGEIVTSRSQEDAIRALDKLGRPEIIITSMEILHDGLHGYLKDVGLYLPLIATREGNDSLQSSLNLSLVTSFASRPVCPEELSHLVKSFTKAPPKSPTHVPIKLRVACDVASTKFDIYLRLSGTNFVRITNKGNEFTADEAEKLRSKGITEVYLKSSDSRDFLEVWEGHLSARLKVSTGPVTIDTTLVLETLEQVERISRAFGWSPESVKASQKIIRDAVAALKKNERVFELLEKKFSENSHHYSRHLGILSYLTSIMCSELSMEDAREKLVMASLMHDLSVGEEDYVNSGVWDNEARNMSNRSPEIARYRLHPLHAAQTAQTIDVLPPDVDQIILQHHESPDGSGFPRGLGANRIHYLAAVFIIAEDLVRFLDDGVALETSIKDFLTWGSERYQVGNFKKIFDGIKTKMN